MGYLDCWFKDTCEDKVCLKLKRGCDRYDHMRRGFERSGLHPNMWKVIRMVNTGDESAFERLAEIKSTIYDLVKGGKNIMLVSPICGNGKTSWALRLMMEYINLSYFCGYDSRYKRALFVSVPLFLARMKMAFVRKDDTLDELLSDFETADLVIWDDIGSVKVNEYDHVLLLAFIGIREVSQLANIYTCNTSKEELINAVGSRLTSRIWDNSEVIEFKGVAKRGIL